MINNDRFNAVLKESNNNRRSPPMTTFNTVPPLLAMMPGKMTCHNDEVNNINGSSAQMPAPAACSVKLFHTVNVDDACLHRPHCSTLLTIG